MSSSFDDAVNYLLEELVAHDARCMRIPKGDPFRIEFDAALDYLEGVGLLRNEGTVAGYEVMVYDG